MASPHEDKSECAAAEHAPKARPRAIPDKAFARAAGLFRAVSDEARLRLLARLSQGELCVSELAEAAGVGLSTVSQQLRLLRSEHLVTRRRSGKHVYYAMADQHVADLIHAALDHAIEEPAPLEDADPE
jgi:ArsR family transcriptional regulator